MKLASISCALLFTTVTSSLMSDTFDSSEEFLQRSKSTHTVAQRLYSRVLVIASIGTINAKFHQATQTEVIDQNTVARLFMAHVVHNRGLGAAIARDYPIPIAMAPQLSLSLTLAMAALSYGGPSPNRAGHPKNWVTMS